MRWIVLVAAVVVAAATVAACLGWIGLGGMGRPERSLAHTPLPDESLTDEDLAGLRFDVVARGYRMSEVDGVIDRLRRELTLRGMPLQASDPGLLARDEDAPDESARDEAARDEPARQERDPDAPARPGSHAIETPAEREG